MSPLVELRDRLVEIGLQSEAETVSMLIKISSPGESILECLEQDTLSEECLRLWGCYGDPSTKKYVDIAKTSHNNGELKFTHKEPN